MTQNGGVLTITQRRWSFGLFFVIVAVVLTTVIRTKQMGSSGVDILLYTATPLSFLIGLLYAMSIREITFDTNKCRILLRRGFLGFAKKTEVAFGEITGITVKEVGVTSKSGHSTANAMLMWDVGIDCNINQPLFDIWRADNRERADHIAHTLADAIGSRVVT